VNAGFFVWVIGETRHNPRKECVFFRGGAHPPCGPNRR
jgi:hypothetical protein